MKLLLSLAALSAAYSLNSFAQTERDLDSHVHGAASLNVAIADSSVFIELNTPWNNIVGFEHAPSNDEQKALVDSALQLLDDPTQLFRFNAGDCVVSEVDVEDAMSEAMHDDDHDEHKDEHDDEHHDEHKDQHDDDHKDEHHDEHKDEHHDEHEDEHDDDHKDEHHDDHADKHEDEHDEHAHEEDEADTHSAVLALYTYECGNIKALETIDASLFSLWTGFEELDVQLIGDKGQTAVELNPQSTIIDITQVH